jgi:hypothetical protein
MMLALAGVLAGLLAEPPVHSLPWYFGAVAFGIWAAAAVGFALIVRRRLRARAERRRDLERSRRGSSPPRPAVRDDRSLGSSSDIEPWRRRR